jgi:hypothetical protein
VDEGVSAIFADTGVAAHTSRISIDSEIAHEARKTIPTKRNSVVISIARKAEKCRNGCWKHWENPETSKLNTVCHQH